MWPIWAQSRSEPARVRFTTPWNDGRRIGSLVRSIGSLGMVGAPFRPHPRPRSSPRTGCSGGVLAVQGSWSWASASLDSDDLRSSRPTSPMEARHQADRHPPDGMNDHGREALRHARLELAQLRLHRCTPTLPPHPPWDDPRWVELQAGPTGLAGHATP